MTIVRITISVAIVVLLALLASFTEAFWWFQKVDGQTVFDDFGHGRGQLGTACLWAAIHGCLSVLAGALFIRTTRKPLESPTDYAVGLVGVSLGAAVFFAIGDITSGWWMLIEGGKYIPLGWGAFLQSFLIVYLVVVLVFPGRFRTGPRQLTFKFQNAS